MVVIAVTATNLVRSARVSALHYPTSASCLRPAGPAGRLWLATTVDYVRSPTSAVVSCLRSTLTAIRPVIAASTAAGLRSAAISTAAATTTTYSTTTASTISAAAITAIWPAARWRLPALMNNLAICMRIHFKLCTSSNTI